MKPLFSVVIPTYNRAIKLKRAIESVLDQSYDNFEILVMDDGSTDDTSTVVASYDDSRITYIWDKNFGGPSRPRNRGVAIAKGEWVCFLDADDWWAKDKLQVCFDAITEQVDFIYHDLEIVTDSPKPFRRKIMKCRQVKTPVLIDLLLKGNTILNSSVVVRRSLLNKIGGIDESREMIAAEDYNTWLRIARLTDQFKYLPRTLGYYLIHSEGISQKDMSISTQSAIAEFIPLLSERQEFLIEAQLSYVKGRFNYLIGNYPDAKKNLLVALRHGQPNISLKSLWMIAILQFHVKD